MPCVDANVLIAAISSDDLFHTAATALLAQGGGVALNITLADALVRPHRDAKGPEALAVLDTLQVQVVTITDDVADRASRLRASYGNRNFPMVDALVVAYGVENDVEIVTSDDTWPEIPEANIRVLTA